MAALVAASLSGAAYAAPEAFLSRFDGQWAGSGTVQRNAKDNHHRVSCTANGQSGATRVSIDGTCRAAIIFSRKIGADLTLDPATGTYTGTYIGSKIGPARLAGKRQGDAIHLVITWPQDVNGDRESQMTITNAGDGSFAVRIDDEVEPGGPVTTTTDISFAQR
ncbi:hypothetical protein N177_1619 [Lutibaculum baratangense AMV1]|uniref:Uncharacterized protein n=1 Tax=Lutibaculum baratangense AMV1 TaxID=631454 RepID=V4R0J3_9HYPH|nr:hypothetical protein N177_1619 [Lutibaculum baratangense AMV1]